MAIISSLSFPSYTWKENRWCPPIIVLNTFGLKVPPITPLNNIEDLESIHIYKLYPSIFIVLEMKSKKSFGIIYFNIFTIKEKTHYRNNLFLGQIIIFSKTVVRGVALFTFWKSFIIPYSSAYDIMHYIVLKNAVFTSGVRIKE